ncbi:MAG: TSUP family transporter [Eubacteriales bacterium]
MSKTFIIPLIIAILSGMGIGGGGLLVIYLTLFESVEQIIAQGANLAFFIIAGTASTVFSARKGKIRWKNTLVMSACGLITSLLGVYIAGALHPDILKKIFGVMLIIGGGSSLFSSFVKVKQKRDI